MPSKTQINDPSAWCVGMRDINVNQCSSAEEMRDYAYYKAKKIKKGVDKLQIPCYNKL